MTFGTLLLDAAPATHGAALGTLHHHHPTHFGGIVLGVGLTLTVFAIVRAIVRRRRFGRGPRRMVRHLFRRLDTSPSQEKVIREALDELRTSAWKLRDQGASVREGLGRAVASDAFDPTAVEAAFASPTAHLPELRDSVARALGRIHEVLTPSQRKEFGALLGTGPGFFAHGRRAC